MVVFDWIVELAGRDRERHTVQVVVRAAALWLRGFENHRPENRANLSTQMQIDASPKRSTWDPRYPDIRDNPLEGGVECLVQGHGRKVQRTRLVAGQFGYKQTTSDDLEE